MKTEVLSNEVAAIEELTVDQLGEIGGGFLPLLIIGGVMAVAGGAILVGATIDFVRKVF